MKETLDIINAFGRAKQRGENCVLASVVRVQGSTYRRPGARALFLPNRDIVGLIGGGCLETDLWLQAEKIRTSGRPRLVFYDNTSSDDILWGLGLGCNGKVEVLLELLDSGRSGPLEFIAQCLNERSPGVMATVIRSDDSARLASRCLVQRDGTVRPSDGWDARLDCFLHASKVAASREPEIVDTGDTLILIEAVEPPLRLIVVGAGPDAVPLVAMAVGLGWRVEVFDHRETFSREDRFPGAQSVTVAPIAHIAASAKTDARTAVVMMTHHFLNDRELMRGFLASNAGYCGVLGPGARRAQLLESLNSEGYVPSREQLRRLKAPVGLDLGAETPEEIALSICAEIQSWFAGYGGAPLTDKAGPIHA